MALPMEFWGVEVKAGQPLKVDTDGKLLHLSQASLGEWKSSKGKDSVPVHVKFGDKKLVLGTLSPETIPQLSFDLVFEKEFELSHNWKNGSVYFCGYFSAVHEEDDSSDFESEISESEAEEELEVPVPAAVNGKDKSKPVTVAAKQNQQAKPKVSILEPMKVDQDDSDDDEDEDDSSEDEGSDNEADSEDEDDSDEEETPKKAESGKKRPAEPAVKTPTPNKKPKLSTPQKTDGKKGGHTATPHPAKQTGGKLDKSKDQPKKSPGHVTPNSQNKSFNSNGARKSHSAGKHRAK